MLSENIYCYCFNIEWKKKIFCFTVKKSQDFRSESKSIKKQRFDSGSKEIKCTAKTNNLL